MKKKITAILLIALMLTSFAAIPSSAAEVKPFTDFEGYAQFEEGVYTVDVGDSTKDTRKEYAVGYDYDSYTSKSTVSIADGKGVDGSKALSIVKNADKENNAVIIYASGDMITDISGSEYLVVWVDLTDVDFRKACFGLVAEDSSHTLYRTDEQDSVSSLPFHIFKDGAWLELSHGDDGCFGVAQDTSVANFKGYAAFPISDFVSWDSADAHFDPETTEICGVFFYYDLSDESMLGKPFYVDNIAFCDALPTFDDAPDGGDGDDEEEGGSIVPENNLASFGAGYTNVALGKTYVPTLPNGGSWRAGVVSETTDGAAGEFQKLTDGYTFPAGRGGDAWTATDYGAAAAYDAAEVSFTLDLGAETDKIKAFTIDLYDTFWGIGAAESVKYEISSNGTDFTEVGTVTLEQAAVRTVDSGAAHDFTLTLNETVSAKYVRVTCKAGSHIWSSELQVLTYDGGATPPPTTGDISVIAIVLAAVISVLGAAIVAKKAR